MTTRAYSQALWQVPGAMVAGNLTMQDEHLALEDEWPRKAPTRQYVSGNSGFGCASSDMALT